MGVISAKEKIKTEKTDCACVMRLQVRGLKDDIWKWRVRSVARVPDGPVAHIGMWVARTCLKK